MGDVLDVDAPGGDVGRDEDVDLAGAERAQRLLTGPLAQVAVDGRRREATLDEIVGDLRRRALGAAEDDGQAPALRLEDAREHLDLVHRVRAVGELGDGLDGRAVALALLGHRADVRRLAHVATRERDDRPGHRCREEHRLARRRREGEDLLDVRQEAEVEHLVGLVEDEGLNRGEVEVPLLRQVDEASGCPDDDFDPSLEGLDLRLVGAAAVDGQHADAATTTGLLEVAGDLDGQLPGGGDGEGLRPTGVADRGELRVVRRDDPVEHRHTEAERLTGSGLGLTDDVVPAQGDRQGHRLDGEGGMDAGVGERVDNVLVDAEIGEGLGAHLREFCSL